MCKLPLFITFVSLTNETNSAIFGLISSNIFEVFTPAYIFSVFQLFETVIYMFVFYALLNVYHQGCLACNCFLNKFYLFIVYGIFIEKTCYSIPNTISMNILNFNWVFFQFSTNLGFWYIIFKILTLSHDN